MAKQPTPPDEDPRDPGTTTNEAGKEDARQRLIEDLAFLVVRQHQRDQLAKTKRDGGPQPDAPQPDEPKEKPS